MTEEKEVEQNLQTEETQWSLKLNHDVSNLTLHLLVERVNLYEQNILNNCYK